MHVFKNFWTEVILCACHLINKLSSSVLQNKISFSCMYPDKPTFSIVHRVFDSTYFVQNLQPGLDKLKPIAIKCVFVNYS